MIGLQGADNRNRTVRSQGIDWYLAATRRRAAGASILCFHSNLSRRITALPRAKSLHAVDNDGGLSCLGSEITAISRPFEVTRKRRKSYPSETQVKRGVRYVHGDVELLEKLGRNDLCPCGSGRRFQALLPQIEAI